MGIFDPKSPESIEAAYAAQSDQADPADDTVDEAQDDGEATEHTTEHDDTDETSAEEPTQEEPDADDTAEQWVVPGKFRTVDDLVRAYQNAESQLGRLHRELAELRKSGTQQQVDEKQQQIADAERSREMLREFLRDPQGTLRREAMRIQQEQQQQLAQRSAIVHEALADVAARYPDFADLQAQVSQFIATRPAMQRLLQQLQSDPNVTAQDFVDLLDTAYHAVKAETATQALAAAREQGRQEAQQSTQARQRARGATQGAKRGHEPAETYEERARREILQAGPPSRLFGR